MEEKAHKKIIKILIFLLLIKSFIIFQKYTQENNLILSKNHIIVRPFGELLNSYIKNNTILILEMKNCHHECIPGFMKYLFDLGYNIDILVHESGFDAVSWFPENKNIRLFIFHKISQILLNIKNVISIIKKYKFVLLQSTDKKSLELYKKLELLKLNNIIFVFHELGYADINYSKYFNQNRIWTLGNFSKGLQVNPFYFGDIKLKDKNNKTKFFVTSTIKRNYTNLIKSAQRLKNEKFNFEIIVIGRNKVFNISSVPKDIKDIFIFKGQVTYSKLYEIIENSDYIIITLTPESKYDNLFRKTRVTGSAQLSYGFLKPCIIDREFAYFYNFDDKNSLIYNDLNLYNAMKKAILLNNNEYNNLRNNILLITKKIYSISIMNIQKLIPEIKHYNFSNAPPNLLENHPLIY